jgi:Sigma-70 region 2
MPMKQDFNAIVVNACCYPPGSAGRQKLVHELVVAMQSSGQIWRAMHIPRADYHEVLQETWLWFCPNLDQFDPTQAQVMTWFNNRLRFKIQEHYRRLKQWNDRTTPLDIFQEDSYRTLEIADPENLWHKLEAAAIWQDRDEWLAKNQRSLRRIHIRQRLDVNCYRLIPQRFAPEPIPWKQVAIDFALSEQVLGAFFQRECVPLLREFARQYGYVSVGECLV